MSRYRISDDRLPRKNTKNHESTDCRRKTGKNYEKLADFLRLIKIEEYLKVFKENEILYEDLQFLKENDILELNLPIGPRNRLINALDNIDEYQEEEELIDEKPRISQENREMLKEIYQLASDIAHQQDEMINTIKKCKDDLQELREDCNEEQYNQSVVTPKYKKMVLSSTSPNAGRAGKPTLSSIAKQKVLPNKYMQVSPLRASYYSKLMT